MHDLSGGGVERQSLILASELRAEGIDVTLVLHQVRGPLLANLPADVRVVDLKSRRTLQDIPRLASFLRRSRPDILLANLDHNNIAAMLAKAVAFSRTRVVICQHNPISASFAAFESWTYKLVPLAYRSLSVLASRAVAVSSGVAAELNSLAGVPSRKIYTIHNPVVGPDFQARSQRPVEHLWFDQPDHPVFITAGRLVPQKDHETLIRAFALHRQRFASRLLILGMGPLQAELEALSRELNVADAIGFLGYQPEALPFFRRADAFVLSSRCEGFGNVLVEAMACGTPVISADCDHGPAEILGDGRFGLLVPPRDPAALALALNQIPTLRTRFPPETLRGRAEEFSYSVCAGRYRTLFNMLMTEQAVAA
jgi:glycosyltransferase involved in cell wall biosynthesis